MVTKRWNTRGARVLVATWVTALAVVGGLLVTPTGAAAAPTSAQPGTFTSLEPARLLDTRTATGVPTTASVPGNGAVTFTVAGRGGVPTTGAAAVVLTVTVTRTSQAGHITAHPAGSAAPLASNLNFAAGQTVANAVTVKLSPDGRVTLRNGSPAPVHLVADVAGWYATAATPAGAAGAGTFTSVAPARLLDTRTGAGAPAGTVAAGGVVSFAVAGQGGVPSVGAGAAVLNLTVTGATGGGHVTAYPADQDRPVASNLNFAAGQTIANAVTVKLSSAGVVTLHNGSNRPVHLVVDVAGWYVAGTATAVGAFTALPPSRLLDTREQLGTSLGVVPAQGSVTFTVAGRNGVPLVGAAAAVLNVTVTKPGAAGHVTAYPTGAAQPLASNLNFTPAQTIPVQVTVKLSADGRVTLHNGSASTVHLVADLAGFFAAPGNPYTLLSANAAGVPSDGTSRVLDLTPDAHHALLVSTASDIDDRVNRMTGTAVPLFVRDVETGATTMVVAPTAEDRWQMSSWDHAAAISDDGDLVAFASEWSRVVPGDTNARADVFVRDLRAGTTTRLLGRDGAQLDAGATSVAISGDGRYVGFLSASTNVTEPAPTDGAVHTYRWDRRTGDVVRLPGAAPVRAEGVLPGAPSLSADGRYVAYGTADPLTAADTDAVSDVYVHDAETGVTTLVSTAATESAAALPAYGPTISADGSRVAWTVETVPGAGDVWPRSDVYHRDWRTSTPPVLTSVVRAGIEHRAAFGPVLSADGTTLGMGVHLTNGPNGEWRGYRSLLVDLATGSYVEVPRDGIDGRVPMPNHDGSVVAFSTYDHAALVPGDTNGWEDAFLLRRD